MAIDPKLLPQLLIYGSSNEIKDIIRNLKKTEIADPDKIWDTGIKEYESVPRLDGRAFRYAVRGTDMFLAESLYSAGGAVADTVFTSLGAFTAGDDELNPDLTPIAQIKDAKQKQRARQLIENERLAKTALSRINAEVNNVDVVRACKADIAEVKRFIRPGKPDYNQAQMDIWARFAHADEAVWRIVADYNAALTAKNEKWAKPLKLGKPKDMAGRVGTERREDIGQINPQNRAEFEKYYAGRSPQVTPYMANEEEILEDLPLPPRVIFENKAETLAPKEDDDAPAPQKRKSPTKLQIEKVRRTFAAAKAKSPEEMSR